MYINAYTGLGPNLILAEEQLDEANKFNYLDSYVSPGGRTSNEAWHLPT